MVDTNPPTRQPVFVCGYPGHVGGAKTELWHTLKLWRSLGLDVTVIPPWGAADQEHYGRWAVELRDIGCRIASCPDPSTLHTVPGLRGATVASFCCPPFLREAHRFRALGCRIVWAGCMTWPIPGERRHYRRHGVFDRYVFQSEYQRGKLEPGLAAFGYRPTRGHLIRGAFDVGEFPFRPRPRTTAEPFVVGRISRAAAEKYTPELWRIYGSIPHAHARVMGFRERCEAVTGPAPRFAECLPEGRVSPRKFLATLHALVMPTATFENWPRVGLEAMAAGVPLVVDDRGGWREMIEHGHTGFLCASDADFVRHATALAEDDSLRMRIAHAARAAVERLTDPATIGAAWLNLFSDLE